jgi:hypothetical protein
MKVQTRGMRTYGTKSVVEMMEKAETVDEWKE